MTSEFIETTAEKKQSVGNLWWEKTVEYRFVLNASEEFGIDLLSPLSGYPEAIGDTITRKDNAYFIIEFKRRPSDFKDEYDKYKLGKAGYDFAKYMLKGNENSNYHYVIAGKLGRNGKSLDLYCMRYFDITKKVDSKDLFVSGMNYDQFIEYSQELTFYKLDSDSDGSSDGNTREIHMGANVLALGKNNEEIILPLSFFANPRPKNNNSNNSHPPSDPTPNPPSDATSAVSNINKKSADAEKLQHKVATKEETLARLKFFKDRYNESTVPKGPSKPSSKS